MKYISDISFKIIGCAIKVHRNLGPGLLESIYHQCLYDELNRTGLNVISNKTVPVIYKGKKLSDKLRLDLLVEDLIIIELKAVEVIHPVYKAQLLSYLKLTELPKGILINFHTENISKSLMSMVSPQFKLLPNG